MPETICPFCRRDYPPDFKWCMDDGCELEQNIGQYEETTDEIPKIPCPDCGEMIDPRDVFCGACGAKLEGRIPKYIAPEAPEPEYVPPVELAPEAGAGPAAPMRNCPGCGAAMGLEDTFCGECGRQVEAVTPGFVGGLSERACLNCAAGLEPEDTFCGVCGQPVQPVEGAAAAASATLTSPAPAQIGVQCPNCSAEVAPGDAFCGSCGTPMSAPQPAVHPAAEFVSAVEIVCPKCGMEMSPGDVFCGTCGHNLKEKVDVPPDLAGPEPEFEEEPEPEPVVIVDPFGGKGLKPANITCPKCGLQALHDAEFCSVCGYSFKKTKTDDLAAAPVDITPAAACPNCGSPIEPGDTFCGTCGNATAAPSQTASEPAPSLRPPSAAPADAPVCNMCGLEGEPGQEVCAACGTALTASAVLDTGPAGLSGFDAPPEPVQEISFDPAPAPPAAKPAAADTDKICTCCGNNCPQDAAFCPNCGVDFA